MDMKLKEFLKNKTPENKLQYLPSSFDIIGDILILDINPKIKKYEKLIAKSLLKLNKHIKFIAKKSSIHKGRYRIQKLKILSGQNCLETIHKENNVNVKLNVEKCYFSPRLANERLRIASLIKKNESILVMFSGVGIFNFVISKNSKAKEVYGIELNKIAHKYALENLKLNKMNNLTFLQGDVKKIIPKLNKKFDRIIMPLPKDSPTYLEYALKVLKKHGFIHLYLFSQEKDIPKLKKQYSKNFKVLRIIKCGKYSPYTYRICLDLKT